jgi:hypothetical protein
MTFDFPLTPALSPWEREIPDESLLPAGERIKVRELSAIIFI